MPVIASCLLLLFSCCLVAYGKEIEATSEWTLLGENDTIAAGMHVRMDLTTGEKWVKTIDENEGETTRTSFENTGSAVAQVDANGNVNNIMEPKYDYEMMHRTLSKLPPEERERMGGIPEMPQQQVASKITQEQRAAFEKRMKEIWDQRQAELKAFQQDHLADLPKLLKDRISSIKQYLEDPRPQLQALDLEASQGSDQVGDILAVLQDLEYQVTDLDMARDFYILGGWPLLSSLLADAVHENSSSNATQQQQSLTDADWNKVNLIQAHAAWAVGTMVKNTGEFSHYATAEIEVLHKRADLGKASSVKTTAMDLVLGQFVASSQAVLQTTHPKDDYYDSVMMKVHKTLYALGALLRGNRQAQIHFCADQGPMLLANVLSELADQFELTDLPTLSKDTLKVVQRLLSLASDILMDVTLHASKADQVDEAIRKAFTGAEWCVALPRFTRIPRLYETALLTIQQLAPHCSTYWDAEAVQRQVLQPPPSVRQAWLPEDLEKDLIDERMKLLESTVQAIRNVKEQ